MAFYAAAAAYIFFSKSNNFGKSMETRLFAEEARKKQPTNLGELIVMRFQKKSSKKCRANFFYVFKYLPSPRGIPWASKALVFSRSPWEQA